MSFFFRIEGQSACTLEDAISLGQTGENNLPLSYHNHSGLISGLCTGPPDNAVRGRSLY